MKYGIELANVCKDKMCYLNRKWQIKVMKNIITIDVLLHISVQRNFSSRIYIIKILYNQIENDVIMDDFNNGKKTVGLNWIGMEWKRIES